jgi:hypothetical protein
VGTPTVLSGPTQAQSEFIKTRSQTLQQQTHEYFYLETVKLNNLLELKLFRTYHHGTAITGVLLCGDDNYFATLELPWRDNQQNISCIPSGVYDCDKVFNRRTTGGLQIDQTLLVRSVPDRAGILFHIGNRASDSRGCILLGTQVTQLPGGFIRDSRKAFTTFSALIDNFNEFKLTINTVYAPITNSFH